MRKQGWAVTIDGFVPHVVTFSGSDDITVYTGDGKLRGYYVNTTTDVDCWIKDGSTDKFKIPAGLDAGTWVPLGDAEFATSLVVENDPTVGSVTLVYNPY